MNKILGLVAVAVLVLSACGPGNTTDDSLATDSVGQSIETTTDNAAEGLDAAGNAVGDAVNDAGDALAETGDNLTDAAADAGDAIADTADNALDATADAADNAGDAIADTTDDALDATADAADNVEDALTDADAAAEDVMSEAVEDADAAITVGEGEIGDALIEAELPQEVIDAQADAQEQLITLQDSLAADPAFDASTELEAIRNDLEAAYTDAGPAAMTVWDSVSAQFDDLSSELAAGSETANDSLGALVDNLTNITDEARARGAE